MASQMEVDKLGPDQQAIGEASKAADKPVSKDVTALARDLSKVQLEAPKAKTKAVSPKTSAARLKTIRQLLGLGLAELGFEDEDVAEALAQTEEEDLAKLIANEWDAAEGVGDDGDVWKVGESDLDDSDSESDVQQGVQKVDK